MCVFLLCHNGFRFQKQKHWGPWRTLRIVLFLSQWIFLQKTCSSRLEFIIDLRYLPLSSPFMFSAQLIVTNLWRGRQMSEWTASKSRNKKILHRFVLQFRSPNRQVNHFLAKGVTSSSGFDFMIPNMNNLRTSF